jgi:transposase-like protein
MNIDNLKEKILSLPTLDRDNLLKDITDSLEHNQLVERASRRHILDNKMGGCPHCLHEKYVRFGVNKGSQSYKCKSCNRSFTEYTGTWMAGLQRKDMISSYLSLMVQEKSLDKISSELGINKKTDFDWRHKILASFDTKNDDAQDNFTGITESDETFFLRSEKGMEVKDRESRKRGGKSKKIGISKDQVAVIVTQDRKSTLDLSVAKLGRIGKVDIENAIGKRVIKDITILCSDAHHSYKGFAKDSETEFHIVNASKGERVKGKYHIQHVNSNNNRVKKWIENTFWGVSTKYLQQYMNWYRIKENIKSRSDRANAFEEETIALGTLKRYNQIESRYENLISTQT